MPSQREKLLQQRRRRWRFLGNSSTKHIAKILLEHLDSAGQPLDCYTRYLKDVVSFNTPTRSISLMTSDLLERFYCLSSPTTHPKYFSFFKDACISKLENAINKKLVILIAGGDDTFYKMHDRRVYQLLSRQSVNVGGGRAGRALPEVLFFVLEREAKFWNLYELTTLLDQKKYVQVLTETAFFKPASLQRPAGEECLLQVVAKVLGVPPPPLHVHGECCVDLRGIVFSKDKAGMARELGSGFVLASHLRSSPLSRGRNRLLPKSNTFGVHAVYDSTGEGNLDGLPVVCVTNNLRFYLLEEPYASSVKQVHHRPRHLQKETFPGPAGDRLQLHQQDQQQKRRLLHERQRRRRLEEEELLHQLETCPCGGCKDFKKYEANMSFNGPQKPFHCDLSSFDLFRALGAFTVQVEEDLMNVCRLSVASYDVESVATKVPDEVGNEDANFEESVMSKNRLPRRVQAIHEPCRIGFTDQLREDTNQPSLVFRFDPQNPNGMIAGFVEAIFEHRDKALRVKAGVLQEYFSWIDKYKKKHFEFYMARGWLPPDYCVRWQNFGGDYLEGDEEPEDLRLSPDDDDHDDDDDLPEAVSPAAGAAEDEDELEDYMDQVHQEVVLGLANELDDDDDDDRGSTRSASPEYYADEEGQQDASRQPESPPATNPPESPSSVAAAGPAAEDVNAAGAAATTPADAEDFAASEAVQKLKLKREARRIADVEKSWDHGVFGLLERRLRQLVAGYQIFGFNSDSFDLVLLSSQLSTYAKETGRKHVSMSRQGSRIRWLKMSGVVICEIKRLLGPGTSLASLGTACNLEQVKGIFPFRQFVSLDFLDRPSLPPDAADWASDLNPIHSPSQADVDEAIAFFRAKNFSKISDFLEFYLDLDVIILQRSVVAMAQVYYKILGLNFIESRKTTVSSLSSAGAQHFLARQCRPCNFFPNHARLYNLLKKSLRGGLTSVSRTVSGKHADLTDYVKLLQKQMEEGGEDGGPDLELCARVEASGLTLQEYISHCNAHLLPPGMSRPSTSTVYCDINRQVVFVQLGHQPQKSLTDKSLFFHLLSASTQAVVRIFHALFSRQN
jgi:hypothetical protein